MICHALKAIPHLVRRGIVVLVALLFAANVIASRMFGAMFPLTIFPAQLPKDALADLARLSTFKVPEGATLLQSGHSRAWDGTDSRLWVFQLGSGSTGRGEHPGQCASKALDMSDSEAHWTVGLGVLRGAGVSEQQVGAPMKCWHAEASLPEPKNQQTNVDILQAKNGVWVLVNRLEIH